MQNKLYYIFLGVITLMIVSCSPKQSEIVLAEYGNHNIKMQEFEKAYIKNVGSLKAAKSDSLDNYKNFLDLYVNFKMKLRDAEVRILPENEEIIKELSDYEKTIGASYLLENELYTKGIKDLYDKRSEELRVSHILIRTDSISDEQANKKVTEIIERIQNGSSFEDEVKANSDDQFSKQKGGDIYYLSAGMILPDFENIAYATPVGTVNPKPLKTKYGYHIIKVTERIKRKPKIQASHILIRTGDGKDENTQKELAEKVLARAKAGEDFGELAVEFSDDPGSKQKKGDLGFFGRMQMVPPFDEASFKLGLNEISDLVKTQFGYHIIKVTDIQEYPNYETEKKTLRDMYEKTRRKSDFDALVKKYSEEIGLEVNEENIKDISSKLRGVSLGEYLNSALHKNEGELSIFTIGKESFNLDSLFSYSEKDSKLFSKAIDEKMLLELLDKFKADKVIETKAKALTKSDPKFASLMDEYRNGILIFKLQEDEVWNEMKMDSAKIYNLYQETKENYVWSDRIQYEDLYVKSDSIAKECHQLLVDGIEFDSLFVKYKLKKNNNPSKDGLISATSNELSIAAFELEEGEFSNVLKNNKGWSIVKVLKKEKSRIKTFDEARAEVTSSYQDIESANLENSYVSRLKKIYEPEIFYEELENVYKN